MLDMTPKSAPVVAAAHPQRLEGVRIDMAKADLKKVEDCGKQAHGKVLARSIQIVGWSHKEAAGYLGTDESTLCRWIAAKESQQTWRFEQHPVLGVAYLQAQAEARHGLSVQVEMNIRIRRTA
jgi:hypothetical protein